MILNFCVACGSKGKIQAHHLIPRELGGEDSETNLISLCDNCHDKLHQITKDYKGLSLAELTKAGSISRKDALIKLGIWKGTWQDTANSKEYEQFIQAERKIRKEKAAEIARINQEIAIQQAELLRPHILELIDIHHTRGKKGPTLREYASWLTEKTGQSFTINRVYKILIRLNIS